MSISINSEKMNFSIQQAAKKLAKPQNFLSVAGKFNGMMKGASLVIACGCAKDGVVSHPIKGPIPPVLKRALEAKKNAPVKSDEPPSDDKKLAENPTDEVGKKREEKKAEEKAEFKAALEELKIKQRKAKEVLDKHMDDLDKEAAKKPKIKVGEGAGQKASERPAAND